MKTENNIFDLHLISQQPEFNDLTFSSYFLIDEIKHIIYLPNTNTINIFIGRNNSGKSRFMRELVKMENYYLSKNFYVFIQEYNEIINHIFNSYNNSIFSYTREEILLNIDYENIQKLSPKLENLRTKINHFKEYPNFKRIIELLKFINTPTNSKEKKIFIPTLRSAHSIFDSNSKKIEQDFYQETLIKNYNFKTDTQKIEIFTGLHLYKKILNARNSNKDNRRRFEDFEKFISTNFFNGKAVDIVAEYNFDSNLKGENSSNNIIIHIDGETDRKLYELGDGIQALIVLMFPIFMAQDKTIIFIDEPEINLHPGMQRLFLDQISINPVLKKKNLKYFISTHSNHFLDLTLNKEHVSIYSFSERKNESSEQKQFEIKNVNQGDNSVLKEIGVNNSSVFLANCSIWVEGVSDRNYIKAFLNSYIKDKNNNAKLLKEDIDFAFFEYAGSNIEHYMFEKISTEEQTEIQNSINALALNNKIFLVADSDNASGESLKAQRLTKLERNKNIETKILKDIREIENILPIEVWKKTIDFYCNSKLLSSNRDQITNEINEALNEIKPTNFKKDYIGKFLNNLRDKVGKIGHEFIINQSVYKRNKGVNGTLIKKRELSELVLSLDIPWSTYKKDKNIKQLTESIYSFIIQNKL